MPARHGGGRCGAAADIDLICVGTTTPDLVFPNVGTLLQERLGIHAVSRHSAWRPHAPSFMYALSVADKFVRLGESKCALVVGAETLTRIVDWNDRGTCVLFADGAGAVVSKPSAEPGIISHPSACGRQATRTCCCYPDGVSNGLQAGETGGKVGVQMKGNEVYKVAVNTLGRLVTETLNANNLTQDQLDWLIPHQANIRIIEAIAKRLDLPMERVIVTIDDAGQHLGRLGAARARYGRARRPRQARAVAAVGGVRRRIHLGLGADTLLISAGRPASRKEKRRGMTAAFISQRRTDRITSIRTS